MINTCHIGITRTVEKVIKDKPWYNFNKENFIYIRTSPNGLINPSNYSGVAKTLAGQLNRAINSDLVLGKVFYEEDNGVRISPTPLQLNLLNAQEGKDREEAYRLLNAETPEKDRLDIENDLSFGINEEGESYIQEQIAELPTSTASESTLSKVKEVAKEMGIDIQKLSDYLKGNPDVKAKGANGLADVIRGIVAS